MVYELRSNSISIKVNSKGAEIISVVKDDLEYIWQAKPEVWARHAPVLFPIVGRLKDNTFTYKGNTYTLPQHGFARDMEFQCVHQTTSEVSFELKSDEHTKKNFPFDFKLVISYKVKDNTVICAYEVSNPSTEILYFSIGAHPGFKTDNLNDHTLRFEDKPCDITLLENGLLSEHKEKLHLHTGELPLETTLFERDALVFENKQVEVVELVSPNGRGVEIGCKDWPYFGVWSKKACNEFICLEPWHGITDTHESNGDITQKKGIIKLDGGKAFECDYSMRFF